ncbi:MAG TPA: HipA N-terminal domain-containing protein [Dyadobacter sp.]|jgi:serine/threonine-protein kinase HipA|nr:HipA N-terminal domain-containing protein [Dyadobacter sp.]
MRSAKVFFRREQAGILLQDDNGAYEFHYHKEWVEDSSKPAVSLTLPKRIEVYKAPYLFPFFYNMLPEGSNKQVVCHLNRIDRKDDFGLLLTTAKSDTIGAVTIVKIEK